MSWALFVDRDYSSMSERAAGLVCRLISSLGRTRVLALPTGQTPQALYARFPVAAQRLGIDMSRMRFVNLDEYVGIRQDDPCSFAHYLRLRFFSPHHIAEAHYRLLDGMAADLVMECRLHEEWIDHAGGLGLAILGIGENGHIAFNEPGTDPRRRTHVTQLEMQTRKNMECDRAIASRPTRGLTVGVSTLLEARHIVILASGAAKTQALSKAFLEPPSAECPASFLQEHDSVHVIADCDAVPEASALRARLHHV